MESIKATISSVRWRSPERNWLIANMKAYESKSSFTATGDIPYSETEEPIQLYGEWVDDKKYGRQFKVSSAHRILPTSLSGLSAYLASSEDIRGVGPVRARALVDHFGSSLWRILDKTPENLTECPGISDETARRIRDGWKKDSSIRQLALFLANKGISPRWATKILKQWNPEEAVNKISSNPYSLTEIDGIGFITADEIACALGAEKDSPERISAACVYVVAQGLQEGNVYLHEHQLIDNVVKLIVQRGKDETIVRERAATAVKRAVESKTLALEEVSDGFSTINLLYLPYLYKAEKALAESIAELSARQYIPSKHLNDMIANIQDNQHVQFSSKQVEAIRGSFSNHFMVITGGPGTGKTTCVRAIKELADRLGEEYYLVAPTGRAAKRLSEVTSSPTSTIHRLLKWRDGSFVHSKSNPLEGELFIVDEASMLDLDLANKFIEAVPDGARVVFIGDVDQLPSIGAGSTLRDIISSHTVPTVILDTIFRQAEQSLIVRNAHLIRRGEMPRFPETKGVKENSYVMWIPPNTDKEVEGKDNVVWLKDMLARLVSTYIADKVVSQDLSKIDPIRDIQVLVPMKKHTMGSHELNITLQNALNPNGEEFTAGGKRFRIGDRVMQTRNNYEPGMDVYNGDIGFIISNSIEDKEIVIDFYGRMVAYPYEDLEDVVLAYAQTIHKSQGSEYPVVVVVMGYQHWPMLERNLLYTANTRAKDMCLYLASKGAIERAVKNNPVKERNTYLAQRLKAYKSKEIDSA